LSLARPKRVIYPTQQNLYKKFIFSIEPIELTELKTAQPQALSRKGRILDLYRHVRMREWTYLKVVVAADKKETFMPVIRVLNTRN